MTLLDPGRPSAVDGHAEPEREIEYLPARHDPESCGPLSAGFDARSCLLVLIVIAVVLGAMAAGVVMR
jgi:hypothetical protein